MIVIKSKPAKDHLLKWLLILGVFFLFASVFLHFHHVKNVGLDRYDVMASCESVPLPVFSVPEGIYDQPFELEVQTPEGYDIFYTTDGSIPTVRSYRYKRPIKIDPRKNLNKKILAIPTSFQWEMPYGEQNHCVVLRARCFRDGEGYGKVKNVIYSTPNIKQHQDFQIVHILMEADSLFSPKRGIYVLGEKYYSKKALAAFGQQFLHMDRDLYHPGNYYQRGKNWTRPATFILMDLSGKTLYEQNIMLNLKGKGSRTFPEKSLRIKPDNQNDTVLRYSFFNELPYSSYKRLALRNTDFQSTMIRNPLIHRLANGTRVDTQADIPSVVYINGNYWGIHHISENPDEHYLAAKYVSSLPDINILFKIPDASFAVNYGHESSLKSFEQLLDFIRENSLADSEAYQAVCTQIDVDNFIDYMILETFFCNWDWPSNNVKIYRFERQAELIEQQSIDAGKWRWLFFDLDDGMYFPSTNMFEMLRGKFNQQFVSQIFMGLMENKNFKDKFITRYEYLVKNQLASEKMLEQINIFEQRYQHEMKRHIARWRQLWDIQSWRREIEEMKNFAEERPGIVLEHLKTL